MGAMHPVGRMGQRMDRAGVCGGADMRIMQNDLPAPVTQRLEWLEADSAAQRTAILKLERQIARLQGAFWGAIAGIVFGAIGWGMLT